jgi:hypothetical protein
VRPVGAEHGGRLRGEGIGSGLRLGEGVGGDQLAAREPGQVLRLLGLGAEVDERQRPDGRVRAERPAEGGVEGDLLGHVGCAHRVEPQPAVRFRNLETEQVQLTGLPQQHPGERPIVRVDLRLARQHLAAHELEGSPAEEALLVGEVLAREHVRGLDRRRQEAPAGGGRQSRRHRDHLDSALPRQRPANLTRPQSSKYKPPACRPSTSCSISRGARRS